jgi:hypothetical protein
VFFALKVDVFAQEAVLLLGSRSAAALELNTTYFPSVPPTFCCAGAFRRQSLEDAGVMWPSLRVPGH